MARHMRGACRIGVGAGRTAELASLGERAPAVRASRRVGYLADCDVVYQHDRLSRGNPTRLDGRHAG